VGEVHGGGEGGVGRGGVVGAGEGGDSDGRGSETGVERRTGKRVEVVPFEYWVGLLITMSCRNGKGGGGTFVTELGSVLTGTSDGVVR
jgi:hypothetical protein